MSEQWWESFFDDGEEFEDGDFDIDACTNCGRYFAWDSHHKKIATETNNLGVQRCVRCLRDECWFEGDL